MVAAAAGDSEEWGVGGFAGLTELFDLDKPVIAAVNGYAAGGRIRARAGMRPDRGGPGRAVLGPGGEGGAGARCRRGVEAAEADPRALAMEMLLTGRPIEAEVAERWGLVNRIVSREDLLPTARAPPTSSRRRRSRYGP